MGDRESQLGNLVEAAIRAPSSHNTQPWLFRLSEHDGAIELLADRSRALPVNDPFDREMTISCGAALFNLRVAAAAAGLACDVEAPPANADDHDLLARVRVGPGASNDDLAALQPAIDKRHSTRDPFEAEDIPTEQVDAMCDAAQQEGATLRRIEGGERGQLASLIAEGDRLQFSDPRWRRELASWMHPRRKRDGLATSAIIAPISRLVVRNFDLGERVGETDESLAKEAPVLAVLSTPGDTVADWLIAGQALQRLLLVAASCGYQAGYLNQPCQVEQLRGRLAELASPGQFPQLVLRLGTPTGRDKPSVRRKLAAVIIEE